VKKVAEAMHEHGIKISEKTIYGWENGHSMPSGDMLLILCDIYATPDILAAFGYTKESLKENGRAEAAAIISRLSPKDREYIVELARRLQENR
jgi:predicted transcriptional regulator